MATRQLARIDIHELMRLAREGDREARGELARSAAERHLYETAELGAGYIEGDVEQMLLNQLPDGEGALHREAVAARLARMREELTPPGSSPIEQMLAERRRLVAMVPGHRDGGVLGGHLGRYVRGEGAPQYAGWKPTTAV